MKDTPLALDGATVLWYTSIDQRHRFTGNTKQYVDGVLMGAMAGLAICQYRQDTGFYLFGCDADWETITDTYHATVEEAKEQAEFEYEGVTATWRRPADR